MNAPARQRTIRRPVSARGKGIHSAEDGEVTCFPAPAGSGIVFRRLDQEDAPPIPARLDAVVDTRRGVTLGMGPSRLRTVEHLLAAVSGLGITNLRIDVRGDEVPALDGSAAPYCELLADAGIVEQDGVVDPIYPASPVWVADGKASLLAIPAPRLRITYVVPLHHAVLGAALIADVVLEEGAFAHEVAGARTWGFAGEVEELRALGLAAGATLANALGVGAQGYLNPPRMPDEPARHKILDLIGDLTLLGRPLAAHVIAVGAGHTLHLDLARAILRG